MKAKRFPSHALIPANAAYVSGTITLDLNPSLSFFFALTGDLTIANPTSPPGAGHELVLILAQDATGGHALTWGSQFTGGPLPAINSAANSTSVFRFLNISTGVPDWFCVGFLS